VSRRCCEEVKISWNISWKVPGKSLGLPLGWTLDLSPGLPRTSQAPCPDSRPAPRQMFKYSVPSVPRAAHGLGTEGLGRHRCFRPFLSPNPIVAWIPVGPRGCWRPGGPHVRSPPAPRRLGLLALLRRCDLAFQVDKRSRVGSRDQGGGCKPGYGPSSSFLRLHEGLACG
jgi:hypothetical protein